MTFINTFIGTTFQQRRVTVWIGSLTTISLPLSYWGHVFFLLFTVNI